MNKDTIKGGLKQAEGSVQKTYGKVTGDKQAELEGNVKKAVGKVQSAVGNAKDAVK